MIDEKREIILSEGVPVEVIDPAGTITPTLALVGRSSRQSNAIITLEAHRRGHFLPEINIDSGDHVHNTVTDERYLVIGLLRELIMNEVAASIAHMVLCNTKLTVSSLTETVNDRGDIVTENLVTVNGLDVFVQALNASLKQETPGMFVDAEYLISAPAVDINPLDRVVVESGVRQIPLKVVHLDYITYPGTVLIQACTETRA